MTSIKNQPPCAKQKPPCHCLNLIYRKPLDRFVHVHTVYKNNYVCKLCNIYNEFDE